MSNNYALIMAGGSGTRLWPLSVADKPKQFIDILGIGKSLLKMTYDRTCKVVDKENIYIVAPHKFLSLILDDLEIDQKQVIIEPEAKNTAPCIFYACQYIYALNKNANLLVLPADHLILKNEEFINTMNSAFNSNHLKSSIFTFGVKPTHPETGYGYIEHDNGYSNLKKVKKFHEKPDLEIAKKYFASDDFLWNSGIFMWSIDTMLHLFSQYSERIEKCFEGINWENITYENLNVAYSLCPSVSIDYEIMEAVNNIMVYQSDFDWSDLGSWKSVYDHATKDSNENFLSSNVVDENVNRCLVKVSSGDKIWALMDVDDLIIVESENKILITKMTSDQRVKQIMNKTLKSRNNE